MTDKPQCSCGGDCQRCAKACNCTVCYHKPRVIVKAEIAVQLLVTGETQREPTVLDAIIEHGRRCHDRL